MHKGMMLFGIGLLAGCATWATAASAQATNVTAAPQADADTNALPEITVTAQFREQSIQKTPLSITAVNSKMLEARGQVNVQQIADQVPDVTLKPASGVWGPSLVAAIRGVGAYNNNPTFEPGVGVFIDDVYYATLTGSLIDLVDINRVEVLRGPQGTLTGKNSIGGAIRIITNVPTGSDTGYVDATGGSDNLIALRAGVDLGLTDKLSMRLSGAMRKQAGYIERLDFGCVHPNEGIPATHGEGHCKLGKDLGGVGNQAVRGTLRFRPSEGVDLQLTGQYEHEDHTGPGSVLVSAFIDNPDINPAPGVPIDSRFICGKFCNYSTYQTQSTPDHPFAASADPDTLYNAWSISGRAIIDLTDTMELTSITAYRQYHTRYSEDGDLTPGSVEVQDYTLRHKFFSQELRLNGELGKLEYTVGGFYSHQRTFQSQFVDLPTLAIQYTTADPIPSTTAAAFGTAVFHATDKLTFTGGIRYTHDKKTYTFHRRRLDGSIDDPLIEGASRTSEENVVDYRGSVDYRWNPSFLTYVTVSTGFRGGGINPNPLSPALVLPFGPEKLRNYEAGFKSDFFSRSVRVNASIFYDVYSGIQLTRLSCPELGFAFCVLVVNAGTAKNKGAELEVTAHPTKNLLIDGSFSYLDFKYSNLDPGTFLSKSFVTPFTPKTKWSVGVQYEIGLSNLGTLTPRFDASYQSAIFTNASNAPTNRISPYMLANAHLTWRNERQDLSIALDISNLFNKYYFLNNYDNTTFFGLDQSYPGRPREFSVSVRKKF